MQTNLCSKRIELTVNKLRRAEIKPVIPIPTGASAINRGSVEFISKNRKKRKIERDLAEEDGRKNTKRYAIRLA